MQLLLFIPSGQGVADHRGLRVADAGVYLERWSLYGSRGKIHLLVYCGLR